MGGKTGVNHPLGKNMIGAFYQPRCVLIDTDSLNTLPDRELASGISGGCPGAPVLLLQPGSAEACLHTPVGGPASAPPALPPHHTILNTPLEWRPAVGCLCLVVSLPQEVASMSPPTFPLPPSLLVQRSSSTA